MPTTDIYAAFAPSPSAPARRIQAVTPADGTDLPVLAKALYVGGAGAINMSATSVLAANLYAPLTDLSFSAGTEIFGAAFVGRLLTAGPVRIHYDTSVIDPASACAE